MVIAAMLAGAWDLGRTPEHQLVTKAAIASVHAYQATVSRWFGATGVRCRFDPTCSHYGEAVLKRYGLVRGGWLAAKRVIRCGPWTAMGTVDPPPI